MSDFVLELPYIAHIPYNVQIDESLSDSAKLYFGQIVHLSIKTGYIWATDKQLADMKKVSIRTIERWHKELADAGHIVRECQNIPVNTENGLIWEARRKIYVNPAFYPRHPNEKKKTNENFESESNNDCGAAKNGGSTGTAKNGGSTGTAKNGGLKDSTLDGIDRLQPASAEVVVISPHLEKLEISESLAKKISKEYSDAEIDLAVNRCLTWQGRPSDDVGIITTLKKAHEWNDYSSKEAIAQKNMDFLKTLEEFDMKTIANNNITVGKKYIEFVSGMKVVRYDIEDVDFRKDVSDYFEYLKRLEER
jgi:hypothetical protein